MQIVWKKHGIMNIFSCFNKAGEIKSMKFQFSILSSVSSKAIKLGEKGHNCLNTIPRNITITPFYPWTSGKGWLLYFSFVLPDKRVSHSHISQNLSFEFSPIQGLNGPYPALRVPIFLLLWYNTCPTILRKEGRLVFTQGLRTDTVCHAGEDALARVRGDLLSHIYSQGSRKTKGSDQQAFSSLFAPRPQLSGLKWCCLHVMRLFCPQLNHSENNFMGLLTGV